MKKYIYYVLILTLCLSLNCTSDSLLEADDDTVVIQAYIYAGESVTDIRVTSTLPLGTEDTSAPPVNNADVTIIKDDLRYSLQPSPGDSGYYHYEGIDLTLNAGDVVRIEVIYNDELAYGETVIPPPPEGVSTSNETIIYPTELTWEWRYSEDFEKSQMTINWEGDGESLYFVVIETIDSNPQPVDESVFPFKGKFQIRSRPSTADSLRVSFMQFEYLGLHRAKIYIVNQEYADLYETQSQDSRDLNEPLTNIVNGLGVFSAFNSDSVFFEVKY